MGRRLPSVALMRLDLGKACLEGFDQLEGGGESFNQGLSLLFRTAGREGSVNGLQQGTRGAFRQFG
jgi:hypothetical protein